MSCPFCDERRPCEGSARSGGLQTDQLGSSEGSLRPPAPFFVASPGFGCPLHVCYATHEALKNDRMTVNVGLLNRGSSYRSYGGASTT